MTEEKFEIKKEVVETNDSRCDKSEETKNSGKEKRNEKTIKLEINMSSSIDNQKPPQTQPFLSSMCPLTPSLVPIGAAKTLSEPVSLPSTSTATKTTSSAEMSPIMATAVDLSKPSGIHNFMLHQASSVFVKPPKKNREFYTG